MANAGDTYTVKLKETYLDWGEYRKTYSREAIPGEGYIPIPKKYAQEFGVFNSNPYKSYVDHLYPKTFLTQVNIVLKRLTEAIHTFFYTLSVQMTFSHKISFIQMQNSVFIITKKNLMFYLYFFKMLT